MQPFVKFHLKHTIIFWVLASAALTLQLYLAWQPLPVLISRYNADDAYYYLTIARNVAAGRGVTFDGLAITNGFHPLYLALIVPLYSIFPHDLNLTAHLAFSLLVVFNTLTALPLYSIIKRIVGEAAGYVVAMAWLFNPWVIAIGLEGVESPVYVFLAALTISLYLETRRAGSRWISFGLALGLTILARSDGIFLLIAILADLVMQRKTLKFALAPLGICGIVLTPWVFWNLALFGTILQVSGAAIFSSSHIMLTTPSQTLNAILLSSWIMLVMIAGMGFQVYLLVVPLLVTIILPRYRHVAQPMMFQKIKSLLFLVVYAMLLFGFYAWYLLHRQMWYFLPIILVITIGIGILFDMLTMPRLEEQLSILVTILFVAIFVATGWIWESQHLALYPAQYDGYQVAQWLARDTDPDARIGAWNSGVIGYFADRTVIDLDGVVNNSLYTFVHRRNVSFDLKDIWEYVQASHIDYITDYENVFQRSFDSDFAGLLVPVYEYPSTYSHRYAIKIYHVVR